MGKGQAINWSYDSLSMSPIMTAPYVGNIKLLLENKTKYQQNNKTTKQQQQEQ